MTPVNLIEDLYEGLRQGDGDRMAACYTDDARFEDPAFGVLDDGRVKAMWRMLAGRGAIKRVDLSAVEVDGEHGSARWVAHYEFGSAGRPVENRIEATYRFRDGLIVDHVDHFSMTRWCRQALGPLGLLLGWTPYIQDRVRARALRSLERFENRDS